MVDEASQGGAWLCRDAQTGIGKCNSSLKLHSSDKGRIDIDSRDLWGKFVLMFDERTLIFSDVIKSHPGYIIGAKFEPSSWVNPSGNAGAASVDATPRSKGVVDVFKYSSSAEVSSAMKQFHGISAESPTF